MKFKGTAGLLAVFLVLVGWIYFTDIRGLEERHQAAAEAQKALPIEAEAISGISIIYPDQTITGVRTDTGWAITEPAGIEADVGEWNLLAANVPRIERDQTLTSEPTDLSQYGLADPVLRLAVNMSDGSSHGVLFGNENPRKIYNYAMVVASDEVFLAPSSWLRIFRKEANELRDKSVIRFEQDDIDRIDLSGMKNLRLLRGDEGWLLEVPMVGRADQREVNTFLGSLNLARATGFADDEADLTATGIEDPMMTVVLHDMTDDSDHVLLIGSEKEDEPGHYFVKEASRNAVFIVNGEILEQATRPIFDWRDKAIVSFDREDVLTIQLEEPEDQFALRKSGDDWLLPDGRRAQFHKVSAMLNGLEFERAIDIIDSPGILSSYGLAFPKLRVVLIGDGEEILTVHFGADIENGNGIYCRLNQDSTVKVVPKDVFNRFDMTIEDLSEVTEEPQ